MFIQLTRTDGLPIWLNASFVVTVEPTRSGGSVVVPIGDGLDYDVKESPETVLALLNEAPPAKVVPVRPPKALTKTPDDVSPEHGYQGLDIVPDHDDGEDVKPTPEADKPAPKKKASRRTKKTAEKPAEPAAGAKTVKKKAADEPAVKSEAQATEAEKGDGAQVAAVYEKPEPEDFDKIVADLKARKCRTAKRLRNAIKGFFGKTNENEIDHIIETMINRNLIQVEADGHIDWAT